MYEILAPAGNRECALAAVDAGADAIYLGYAAFSARAGAENFDLTALEEVVSYAHLFGVKVYVAMNTLVKDGELEERPSYKKTAKAAVSALLKEHNSPDRVEQLLTTLERYTGRKVDRYDPTRRR